MIGRLIGLSVRFSMLKTVVDDCQLQIRYLCWFLAHIGKEIRRINKKSELTMKGIILSDAFETRLYPLMKVTFKQLLIITISP